MRTEIGGNSGCRAESDINDQSPRTGSMVFHGSASNALWRRALWVDCEGGPATPTLNRCGHETATA